MITFLLPFVLLLGGLWRRGFGWRGAFLLASTVWGFLLVIMTEVLGLCNALTGGWLRIAWLGAAAGIAATLFAWLKPATRPERAGHCSAEPAFALLLPIILILATLALVGWVASPNNYDSMTYHMARVVHWMQNHNVSHYPTHIERQLHLSPGAEFIILHMQILNQNDRFANFVQWFAMAGSLIGVSFIAARFGASVRGQVFAAAICCSIPMGVLQACSTQNDYVLGFWLVCLVAFILSASEETNRARRWIYFLAAGAALGLAVLTKGTAYCFAPPLIFWFAASQFRRIRWAVLRPIGAVLVMALALNAGHFLRNAEIYGSPWGPGRGSNDGRHKLANDVFGPQALASNLIRNTLTEMAVPSMPVCNAINAAGRRVHRRLGIDPDDPRTTWSGNAFTVYGAGWNDENFAGNPLHVLLILLALPVLVFAAWPEKRQALACATALIAGFVLLCWLLRYQYWCNRLHLPLILLWSPLVALAMDRAWGKWLPHAVLWGQLALAVPIIVMNVQHPLRGPNSIFASARQAQYCVRCPEVQSFFSAFAEEVRQGRCSRIGLILGWDSFEYPLWIQLRQDNPNTRIEHVYVANASARKSSNADIGSFKPDAILMLDSEAGRGETKILEPHTQPAH